MLAGLTLTLLACGAILQAVALAVAWWSSVEAPLFHEALVALAVGAGLLLHLAGGVLFLGGVRRAHLSLVLAALPPVLLLVLIGLGSRDLLDRHVAAALALAGTLGLVGAAAWRRRIEARAPTPAPGQLAVLAVFTVTVLTSLTITLLPWAAWFWARAVAEVTPRPEWESTGGEIKLVALARTYRLPVDPSISLVHAGRAYHAVASRGPHSLDLSWFRSPPLGNRRPWLPEPNPIKERFAALARRAVVGLTAAEMAYLQRLAADPGFRDVALVARAPNIDGPGALLLQVPIPEHLSAAQLLFFNQFLGAVRALTFRASLELARRQVGVAETTLRETISLGLAVYDNAFSELDTNLALGAIRGQRVDGGLEGLAVLYDVTGRAEDARRLRAAIPPPPPKPKFDARKFAPDLDQAAKDVVDPQLGFRHARSLSATRAALTRVVSGAGWPRGYRTEMLDQLVKTQCANVGEMIFGPEPGLVEAARAYAASMVRWPGEHELYRVAWEGPYRFARFHQHGLEPPLLLSSGAGWLQSVSGSERVVGCASGAVGVLGLAPKF